MFHYLGSTISYYLGYDEEETKPTEKTLRVRHEMLKQIKNSHLKLNKITHVELIENSTPSKFKLDNTKIKIKHRQNSFPLIKIKTGPCGVDI